MFECIRHRHGLRIAAHVHGTEGIIAVAGNPLEDVKLLEDVRFVMKGGAVYEQPAP